MVTKPLPDRALLRQLFYYDPAVGALIWRPRPREMFANSRTYSAWNKRYPTKPAGTLFQGRHRMVGVDYIRYLEHRLIWLYVRDNPVPDIIDHIDGNGLNNRIENLRAATMSQNLANTKKYRTNTTGVKGVTIWQGRFRAGIVLHGKLHHLGSFDTLEEAAAARRDAAERLQGEFARHG